MRYIVSTPGPREMSSSTELSVSLFLFRDYDQLLQENVKWIWLTPASTLCLYVSVSTNEFRNVGFINRHQILNLPKDLLFWPHSVPWK